MAANRALDEKLGRKSLPRQRYQLSMRNLWTGAFGSSAQQQEPAYRYVAISMRTVTFWSITLNGRSTTARTSPLWAPSWWPRPQRSRMLDHGWVVPVSGHAVLRITQRCRLRTVAGCFKEG
jgi:hypothetical protein